MSRFGGIDNEDAQCGWLGAAEIVGTDKISERKNKTENRGHNDTNLSERYDHGKNGAKVATTKVVGSFYQSSVNVG